jgi:hypothetical protein
VEHDAPRTGHGGRDKRRSARRPWDPLSDRDRIVLEFAAQHRIVLAAQVAALLGIEPETADERLHELRGAGLLREGQGQDWAPECEQITREGLRAIDSSLPAPRTGTPGGYLHDVGLAWLGVAAQGGAFGPLRQIVSERQMRSSDRRAEDRADRFAVRLGGVGPAGHERLHYPDLILDTESGHRVALELELTGKSRTRREGILAGYAADPSIDVVVYLVDQPSVGRNIEQSAARLGISNLVRVQRVSFQDRDGVADAGRGADRVADAGRGADRGREARADRTAAGAISRARWQAALAR